jgi:glycosyltransferase involved in cell wall biosynthesis
MMNSKHMPYALVTPARNEEAYIEKTIRSVISQTVKPAKWVIVSDGSTDRTDEIVSDYLAKHHWMELIRMTEHADRHFAAKVRSFNTGMERLQSTEYDIIGNIDADISFEPDFFEFLLKKFEEEPQLGVAGTAFVEGGSIAYDYTIVNVEHVSGQCQLFRRKCFEGIGGYVPIKGGGIDWTAVTTARMMGWKTRTYVDKTFIHHRKMGTGASGTLGAWFKLGRKDYLLGSHPLWEVLRGIYQMKRSPYIIGALFLLSGYLWSYVRRVERPIPQQLIEFSRGEQMRRLKSIMRNMIT